MAGARRLETLPCSVCANASCFNSSADRKAFSNERNPMLLYCLRRDFVSVSPSRSLLVISRYRDNTLTYTARLIGRQGAKAALKANGMRTNYMDL